MQGGACEPGAEPESGSSAQPCAHLPEQRRRRAGAPGTAGALHCMSSPEAPGSFLELGAAQTSSQVLQAHMRRPLKHYGLKALSPIDDLARQVQESTYLTSPSAGLTFALDELAILSCRVAHSRALTAQTRCIWHVDPMSHYALWCMSSRKCVLNAKPLSKQCVSILNGSSL